jgi:PEGA domain
LITCFPFWLLTSGYWLLGWVLPPPNSLFSLSLTLFGPSVMGLLPSEAFRNLPSLGFAMRRFAVNLALLMLILSSGCVYRRMTVMSDPPGARLFVNNLEVGTTPCIVPTNAFIDYGNYKFTLFKDGFEPLEVLQPVPPKWYEYPGIDAFTELGPWTVRDHRIFTYQLQPAHEKSGDELKQQADEFRQRGNAIGLPTVPMTTEPPPGTSAPPLGVSPPPNTVVPPATTAPPMPATGGTNIPVPPNNP